MDTAKPVVDARRPSSWRRARLCAILVLLLAGIFAASWWWTPAEPYVTLELDAECGLFLFSPDGSMLVTGGPEIIRFTQSQGPLRVWDVAGGHKRFSVGHGWKTIETVLFSPDSNLIAAHETKGDLKVWNSRTSEEVANLQPCPTFLYRADFKFFPDGRFLAYATGHQESPDRDFITFWNIESRKEQGSIESYFDSLTFASNGNLFGTVRKREGSGKVKEVLLWALDPVPVLAKQHRLDVDSVSFSPDLQTYATTEYLPDGNAQVAIWDIMTGDKRWSVNFNNTREDSLLLSFNANGKFLSAERYDGAWRITHWDVTATPKEVDAVPKLEDRAILNGYFRPRGLGMGLENRRSFSPDWDMALVKGQTRFERKPFLDNWLPRKYNPFPRDPGGSVVLVCEVGGRKLLTVSDCRDGLFSPDGCPSGEPHAGFARPGRRLGGPARRHCSRSGSVGRRSVRDTNPYVEPAVAVAAAAAVWRAACQPLRLG